MYNNYNLILVDDSLLCIDGLFDNDNDNMEAKLILDRGKHMDKTNYNENR